MNDRVQVFAPDGKHLKSLPVAKPAYVAVTTGPGDIYVFSWMLVNRLIRTDQLKIEATMTHLGPLDNPCSRPGVRCRSSPTTPRSHGTCPGASSTGSSSTPGGEADRLGGERPGR